MKKCIALFFSFLIFTQSFTQDRNQDQTFDNIFIEVSKKTMPCVVFIKAKYDNANETYCSPFDFFNDDFFKHFFHERRRPLGSIGSGFFISQDGYIITNYHVIKNSKDISVITKAKDEYKAKIIGYDERTDIAVIKIDAKNMPFLKFGNSDTVQVGQWVLAVGNPFELNQTVTQGIISATGRQNLHIADYEDFLQTDAAMNPGNSGGPLVDLKGNVIGICTAICSKSGGHMGLNFAIPSKIAQNIIEQIIEKGSVTRGYIGILLQEVDKELADAFSLDKPQGILVTEVEPNSPASKAGLKQGDILVQYNKMPIKDITSFRKEISMLQPGTSVTFKIYRDKKYKNIKVTLGNIPEGKMVSKKFLNDIGIEISQIKDLPLNSPFLKTIKQKEGLIITDVKRNSIAEKAGFQRGMLILQVNHKNIKTVEEFQREIKDKKRLLFLIKYRNITKFISIRLG